MKFDHETCQNNRLHTTLVYPGKQHTYKSSVVFSLSLNILCIVSSWFLHQHVDQESLQDDALHFVLDEYTVNSLKSKQTEYYKPHYLTTVCSTFDTRDRERDVLRQPVMPTVLCSIPNEDKMVQRNTSWQ